MRFTASETYETVRMIQMESLDVRTVTMGISLLDCNADKLSGPEGLIERICSKIRSYAGKLVEQADDISRMYGVPITNKRLTVTPISLIAGKRWREEYVMIAQALDATAKDLGVTFIGGYSALVHKGWTRAEQLFIDSIPDALATTDIVCASVNLATTKAGINMDAVRRMGEIIKELASKDDRALGCVKLVVFANAPEDNPFMAGGFHGIGEPDCVINVGISGPAVVRRVVDESGDADLPTLADRIKRAVFKIVRAGELIGDELSRRLNVEFGIVDLSLAPTPEPGDSMAEIVEAIGLERCGTHGTLAALTLLIDAVKKGGTMASSRVGGLSGTFIPVSEDAGMVRAVEAGALSLDKLEAMTAVCSVGIDMVAIPGDTPPETIAAIIADEMAIGIINDKTTAVRIAPVPDKEAGDMVDWSDVNPLLGYARIMPVHPFSSAKFINRGRGKPGRIPAPITSLRN